MQRTAIALALLALAGTASADITVKLGAAGPLTGPISHIGKDGENGIRLAIEDANAKGITIGGQKAKFELVSEDDQADPRTATTVAQRLADAGVKGVIGHVTSGASIPASRVYEQAGIPVITPSSTSPALTNQGFKVTYRVIANDLQQADAMANYAVKKLGVKRIAVIDDRTAYGQGLADALVASMKKLGVQVVGREFTNDKATDFMSILTKIKGQNPDAIFYGGMDAQGSPLLRQVRQLGLKSVFLSGDGLCTAEMLKLSAKDLDNRVFCTQAGIPMEKMPGGAKFKERFKQRFNAEVQLYAPYNYDAATALIEAMKAANSAEPAKYLPALKALNIKGITGNISFDAKGDIKEGGVTFYSYKDGKWAAAD
ncbi:MULTISPECIES: branched-chain amino acid ABC transporter substrate-binding protein [Uliginosibacterium]|uniref:Branched-chain amino acid ABC transporter substrate-binding protein n=1 Tax=Uliginosibacterium aquaticum TaxID=2731212 RepID=A0ABX2ICC8_9RHOO|nr:MULTISPECIES: branched-chain amino acid ABC transporter substrate-binding protein [Uliginosibacterium]MDO6385940.1 branched-chain amino acid ABC transporter substrate-binding protein [Uliginosibacterium sp. 31-12]NSL54151.1 branched-chain amino acid ABC transporter substrate-binding protein [Uliginosibacterium aquaticum]PLK50189.1 branched chain amino acid ABC transporter substrate-binding protein [Uliginosibacterium sp. TH139]